jgi:site-specific DNA-methyltransferase (adenine-specific)
MSVVMQTIPTNFRREFSSYRKSKRIQPKFICGNALAVLRAIPGESIDCVMTSPPYWGHRQYSCDGIGLEKSWKEYVGNIVDVFREVQRVLKSTGSFWLNIGDSYHKKRLMGIPWRVALELIDSQGWVLRNDVIWNKVKGGPDNSKDKLGNVHEHVFHFVKKAKGYYYDVDSIRSAPKKSRVLNGAVVSATGVTGVRYKRQIELSSNLSDVEKKNANVALDDMIQKMAEGKLGDFRMVIRGQQRATHSDSENVSGRARELNQNGFYFLRYHPKGSKPRDVWDILPEDTQKRKSHFAPYPMDLCRLPLLATCPQDGIALDPFCGTGTTNLVAFDLGRKSVGIDLSEEYIELATERCDFLL